MNVPDYYFDGFEENLNDPRCVQRIYEFSLRQVRGLVDYNDEDDVIQEVFYRLTKWPIARKKYNSSIIMEKLGLRCKTCKLPSIYASA